MNAPWYSKVIGRDMAVDLGTANTVVYARGQGIVLNEPSIVAINARDGRILAVGAQAKRMLGRTPGHIEAIRPLKDGVIADFDIFEKMLRYFIQRVHQRNRWATPRMVICIPSGITGRERRAVQGAGTVGRGRPVAAKQTIPPRWKGRRRDAQAGEEVQGRRVRLRREIHDLPQARAPRLRGARLPRDRHARTGA